MPQRVIIKITSATICLAALVGLLPALSRAEDARWLGVEVGAPPQAGEAASGSAERGVRVITVYPDTGASRAGLLTGDLVLEIEGKPVKDVADFVARIRQHALEDVVRLTVVRNSARLIVPAQVGERPADLTELKIRVAEAAARSAREQLGENDPGYGSALEEVAALQERAGRGSEALPLYREALRIRERSLGEDHPGLAATLCRLGWTSDNLERHEEAAAAFRRCLALREKDAEVTSGTLAWTLGQLGEVLTDIGQKRSDDKAYVEAISLFRRALSLAANAWTLSELASTLNKMAAKTGDLSQLRESEELLRRALTLREKEYGPDSVKLAWILTELAWTLGEVTYRTGDLSKLRESEELLRRALALREKEFGPDSIKLAWTLTRLGWTLMQGHSRLEDAIAPLQRAVSLTESQQATDLSELAPRLESLIWALNRAGRYPEAAETGQKLLGLLEASHGTHSIRLSFVLRELSFTGRSQERYDEALVSARRALSIAEKQHGETAHSDISEALKEYGNVLRAKGQFQEALAAHRKALKVAGALYGKDHPQLAYYYTDLAGILIEQGDYAEAEGFVRQAVRLREKYYGAEHIQTAISQRQLAFNLYVQGRVSESEGLYHMSLRTTAKVLGENHQDTAWSVTGVGRALYGRSKYTEAEAFFQRALKIHRAISSGRDTASALEDLSDVLAATGRLTEAEDALKEALEIEERLSGPDHPRTAITLGNLAWVLEKSARDSEALALYERSLAIRQKALAANHPRLAWTHNRIGLIAERRERWADALEHYRAAGRIASSVAGVSSEDHLTRYDEADHRKYVFRNIVDAAYGLASEEPSRDAHLMREAFEAAQWHARTQSGSAMAQMAARHGASGPDLGRLVRELQDLEARWKNVNRNQYEVRNAGQPARASAQSIQELQETEAALENEIRSVRKQIAERFPAYSEFANPQPLSVAKVQQLLRPNEALVSLFTTHSHTYVWAITGTRAQWHRSDAGADSLKQEVASLRCGLDETAWAGDRRAQCATLLGLDPWAPPPNPLPFDGARAHALYELLFGEIEDLIRGKHLLLALSDALTSLPPHVLLTRASPSLTGGGYRDAAWLAREHALTVLPSVGSLHAVRRNARVSAAPDPFIGFGNPLLVGDSRCGAITIPERCPQEQVQVADAHAPLRSRSSGVLEATEGFFRGGLANVEAIKTLLCPLPDTAHELKCVAKSLGAPTSSVILGPAMTETALKQARLDRYRVIHFATHGLLAGETAQLAEHQAEPALVMSPPDQPTEEDDGLLTASEVAGLRLDADWIVMSACNTASGSGPEAEALSGLARAFFYAGARALLVSHWPVNSYAATMLTTTTFAELKGKPEIGRSEAFRRAMLALMGDERRPWAAHPSVWAPFVVVGEGGAAR